MRIKYCLFFLFLICFFVFICFDSSAKKCTDQLGRVIEVPEDLNRIVSLAPSLTECMFALEQGNKLIGVTKFSDHPLKAKQIPKVGSYVNLDLEKIVSLKPDLCLATKDGNPIDVIKRLEDLGIPVYAFDPRDLKTVMKTIKELGQVLKAQEKAEHIVHNMDQRIKKVQSKVARCDNRPRVFFQIGISPIVSVGSKTFIHELISLAGGTNVVSATVAYPRFSREEVLVMSPDIIVINSMTKNSKLLAKTREGWRDFPEIPAVKKNQIYAVQSDYFDRAGPRLVRGVEILARLFHPHLF